MADNSKTTLELPVKTSFANTSDRVLFIHNAANATAANTASMTTTNFLRQLGVGLPKVAVVAGAAAGNVAVQNIVSGDRLDEVLEYVIDTADIVDLVDLTSEFSIAANGVINNDGGTDTTNNKLVVRWTKLT
jgi:anti-sigma-K factor RskA